MRTIHKQHLRICDFQTIELPRGFQILHIHAQGRDACIWYECDSNNDMVLLDIYCFGTGFQMDHTPPLTYIGTVHIQNFVGHFYRAQVFRESPE